MSVSRKPQASALHRMDGMLQSSQQTSVTPFCSTNLGAMWSDETKTAVFPELGTADPFLPQWTAESMCDTKGRVELGMDEGVHTLTPMMLQCVPDGVRLTQYLETFTVPVQTNDAAADDDINDTASSPVFTPLTEMTARIDKYDRVGQQAFQHLLRGIEVGDYFSLDGIYVSSEDARVRTNITMDPRLTQLGSPFARPGNDKDGWNREKEFRHLLHLSMTGYGPTDRFSDRTTRFFQLLDAAALQQSGIGWLLDSFHHYFSAEGDGAEGASAPSNSPPKSRGVGGGDSPLPLPLPLHLLVARTTEHSLQRGLLLDSIQSSLESFLAAYRVRATDESRVTLFDRAWEDWMQFLTPFVARDFAALDARGREHRFFVDEAERWQAGIDSHPHVVHLAGGVRPDTFRRILLHGRPHWAASVYSMLTQAYARRKVTFPESGGVALAQRIRDEWLNSSASDESIRNAFASLAASLTTSSTTKTPGDSSGDDNEDDDDDDDDDIEDDASPKPSMRWKHTKKTILRMIANPSAFFQSIEDTVTWDPTRFTAFIALAHPWRVHFLPWWEEFMACLPVLTALLLYEPALIPNHVNRLTDMSSPDFLTGLAYENGTATDADENATTARETGFRTRMQHVYRVQSVVDYIQSSSFRLLIKHNRLFVHVFLKLPLDDFRMGLWRASTDVQNEIAQVDVHDALHCHGSHQHFFDALNEPAFSIVTLTDTLIVPLAVWNFLKTSCAQRCNSDADRSLALLLQHNPVFSAGLKNDAFDSDEDDDVDANAETQEEEEDETEEEEEKKEADANTESDDSTSAAADEEEEDDEAEKAEAEADVEGEADEDSITLMEMLINMGFQKSLQVHAGVYLTRNTSTERKRNAFCLRWIDEAVGWMDVHRTADFMRTRNNNTNGETTNTNSEFMPVPALVYALLCAAGAANHSVLEMVTHLCTAWTDPHQTLRASSSHLSIPNRRNLEAQLISAMQRFPPTHTDHVVDAYRTWSRSHGALLLALAEQGWHDLVHFFLDTILTRPDYDAYGRRMATTDNADDAMVDATLPWVSSVCIALRYQRRNDVVERSRGATASTAAYRPTRRIISREEWKLVLNEPSRLQTQQWVHAQLVIFPTTPTDLTRLRTDTDGQDMRDRIESARDMRRIVSDAVAIPDLKPYNQATFASVWNGRVSAHKHLSWYVWHACQQDETYSLNPIRRFTWKTHPTTLCLRTGRFARACTMLLFSLTNARLMDTPLPVAPSANVPSSSTSALRVTAHNSPFYGLVRFYRYVLQIVAHYYPEPHRRHHHHHHHTSSGSRGSSSSSSSSSSNELSHIETFRRLAAMQLSTPEQNVDWRCSVAALVASRRERILLPHENKTLHFSDDVRVVRNLMLELCLQFATAPFIAPAGTAATFTDRNICIALRKVTRRAYAIKWGGDSVPSNSPVDGNSVSGENFVPYNSAVPVANAPAEDDRVLKNLEQLTLLSSKPDPLMNSPVKSPQPMFANYFNPTYFNSPPSFAAPAAAGMGRDCRK